MLALVALAAASLAGSGAPGRAPATAKELHAALRAANPDYTDKARVTVRDGRIVRVDLQGCRVADLAPLKGMRLEGLGISGLALRDLSPIDDMPLRTLAFSPDKLAGRLDRVRRHKTLRTIGLDGTLAVLGWGARDRLRARRTSRAK